MDNENQRELDVLAALEGIHRMQESIRDTELDMVVETGIIFLRLHYQRLPPGGARLRRASPAAGGDGGVHAGPHRAAEGRAAAPRRAACVLRGNGMPTKKKRLTQREKAERAKMKKELQAEGVLPPDKPRLNRKKFARETWAEWKEFFERDPILAEVRLLRAVEFVAGPEVPKITPEQIGVFKTLKIAIELDKFLRRLEAEGRKQYTIGELFDEVFFPVWKL